MTDSTPPPLQVHILRAHSLLQDLEELDEEERELTKAKNDAYEALQV